MQTEGHGHSEGLELAESSSVSEALGVWFLIG